MKNIRVVCWVVGALAVVLTGCGGGASGGTNNSATSLSSDQATFESFNRFGASADLRWNIPFGGGVMVNGTNYMVATSHGLMAQSPLQAGAQTQIGNERSLAGNLGLAPASPSRYLVAGQIWRDPDDAIRRVTYVGAAVRVDFLASDQLTVLTTAQFSNYTSTSLGGYMGNSPQVLLSVLPIGDWIGFNNFSATAQWLPDSAYVTYRGSRVGQTVFVADCPNTASVVTTTTNTPTPCATGATLDGFFPVKLVNGNKPFEVDQASDGSIRTVQGVRMWVASDPLPLERSATQAFRVFFELQGNVYVGTLETDGTTIRYGQNDGSVVEYHVSLNQAAVNSIQAGLITGPTSPGNPIGSSAMVATVDLFGIGGHGVNGSLSPADLRQHYRVPGALTGVGQKIAIVDAPGTGDVADDLNVFSQYFNLPQCNGGNPCFQHIDLSNGAAVPSNNDWGGEVALDTQMVHAMAPAATVVLVTAASGSYADLKSALHYALALPGVTAVSLSYGNGGLSSSEQSSEDTYLAAFQAKGGAVFASSGDSGYVSVAPYPAASPYVTAVGGTRIQSVAGMPGGVNESVWAFSGGGVASYGAMPAWQSAYLGAAGSSIGFQQRTVPDVAAVADGAHSAFGTYHKQRWFMSGGTSAAAPLWAGISALFGEYLNTKSASLTTLIQSTAGGFNGLLYQSRLGQGASPALVALTLGSNAVLSSTCQVCLANGGYNEATGLGAPNVGSWFGLY